MCNKVNHSRLQLNLVRNNIIKKNEKGTKIEIKD